MDAKHIAINARKQQATPRGVGVMCQWYAERASNATLWDTEGNEYIDADKYRELSAEEAERYWTINNGDLFGKGLLDDFEKESEFLKQQYTGKVLSFSDNRRGSLLHWKIGGA